MKTFRVTFVVNVLLVKVLGIISPYCHAEALYYTYNISLLYFVADCRHSM